MQTHLGFPLDILPAKAYNTDVSKREGEIMTEHEQHDRSDRNGERDRRLEEDLILAWLRATSVLKNTRITQKMIYNEAVVMAIVYERYREDGVGAVSFGEICRRTRMLKSLVNRTIGSLTARGFLERRTGEDKRTTYVIPIREKLPEFLEEHERSLALSRRIIALIGEEDARTFCRIAEKVFNADPLPGREKDD